LLKQEIIPPNPQIRYEDGQREQYSWKFATCDVFKDQLEDDDEDEYMAIFLAGHNNEEEAKMGHENIVKYYIVHGYLSEGGDDEALLQDIAKGIVK